MIPVRIVPATISGIPGGFSCLLSVQWQKREQFIALRAILAPVLKNSRAGIQSGPGNSLRPFINTGDRAGWPCPSARPGGLGLFKGF